MLLDFVITASLLALIGLVCAYISRPLFTTKNIRITSQSLAVFLLLISFILSKALSEAPLTADSISEPLLWIAGVYVVFKSVAMYLIACYAKSVNKSPYWCFVAILNVVLAVLVMWSGLWKSDGKIAMPKREKMTNKEMVSALTQMIDDPDTPQETKARATERLQKIESMKT